MYAHADLELQWLHVIFNAAFILERLVLFTDLENNV